MLNLRLLLLSGLALGTTLLAGCGGHHDGGSNDGTGGTGGTTSGSGGIAFSAGSDYNGNGSKISKFTFVQGAANDLILSAQGTVATVSGTTANTRIVDVVLTGSTPEGTTITLAEDGTSTVAYSETSGADNSATKSWTSVSGTVLVKTRNASQVVLQLTDVRVTHGGSNDTASTGGVTLNGTITANLTSNQ